MSWESRCDNPRCQGVVIDRPTLTIQACDDCKRFKSDEEAAEWLLAELIRKREL